MLLRRMLQASCICPCAHPIMAEIIIKKKTRLNIKSYSRKVRRNGTWWNLDSVRDSTGFNANSYRGRCLWEWRHLIWAQPAHRNRTLKKPPRLNEPTSWACALLSLLPSHFQSESNMLNESSFLCLGEKCDFF